MLCFLRKYVIYTQILCVSYVNSVFAVRYPFISDNSQRTYIIKNTPFLCDLCVFRAISDKNTPFFCEKCVFCVFFRGKQVFFADVRTCIAHQKYLEIVDFAVF